MTRPPTLTLDIETSPNIAHVWSLWRQNVSLSQLQERGQVIAFAAKWYGQSKVEFRSDHHDGHEKMIERAHALLNEAEIVVHFNGTSFDLPHLRRQFLLADLGPTSPVREIDLKVLAAKEFRFVSNKLDNLVQELGIGKKVSHTGHDLWVRCMAGDESAWRTMRRYNIHDVRITEELYDRLTPWVSGNTHVGMMSDAGEQSCGRCGGTDLQSRGTFYTSVSAYPRFYCTTCGSWSRGKSRLHGADLRGIK